MAIETVEETSNEVSDNNELVAQLLGKPRNTDSFTLYLGDGDDKFEIEIKMQAMGIKAYDKLIEKHPPSEEDKTQGMNYDLETFAPALLAECLVRPRLNLTQAKKLWAGGDDENWSRGDVESLFSRAIRLNHRDSTVPFSKRG